MALSNWEYYICIDKNKGKSMLPETFDVKHTKKDILHLKYNTNNLVSRDTT